MKIVVNSCLTVESTDFLFCSIQLRFAKNDPGCRVHKAKVGGTEAYRARVRLLTEGLMLLSFSKGIGGRVGT